MKVFTFSDIWTHADCERWKGGTTVQATSNFLTIRRLQTTGEGSHSSQGFVDASIPSRFYFSFLWQYQPVPKQPQKSGLFKSNHLSRILTWYICHWLGLKESDRIWVEWRTCCFSLLNPLIWGGHPSGGEVVERWHSIPSCPSYFKWYLKVFSNFMVPWTSCSPIHPISRQTARLYPQPLCYWCYSTFGIYFFNGMGRKKLRIFTGFYQGSVYHKYFLSLSNIKDKNLSILTFTTYDSKISVQIWIEII